MVLFKDEAANFNANVVSNNNFKPFEYKTRLIGNKDTKSYISVVIFSSKTIKTSEHWI